MPLVINGLGGGDTHTQTDARTETILRKQVCAGRHVPGLKIEEIYQHFMYIDWLVRSVLE